MDFYFWLQILALASHTPSYRDQRKKIAAFGIFVCRMVEALMSHNNLNLLPAFFTSALGR
jgi:hypothetical protein